MNAVLDEQSSSGARRRAVGGAFINPRSGCCYSVGSCRTGLEAMAGPPSAQAATPECSTSWISNARHLPGRHLKCGPSLHRVCNAASPRCRALQPQHLPAGRRSRCAGGTPRVQHCLTSQEALIWRQHTARVFWWQHSSRVLVITHAMQPCWEAHSSHRDSAVVVLRASRISLRP